MKPAGSGINYPGLHVNWPLRWHVCGYCYSERGRRSGHGAESGSVRVCRYSRTTMYNDETNCEHAAESELLVQVFVHKYVSK